MAHTTTHRTLVHSGIAIAALSMLTLAGCATGDDTAEFAGGGQTGAAGGETAASPSPEATPELRTDPGFTYDDISKDVTVTDTTRPEQSAVVTPSGTLTINEVQEVATVDPDAIGLGAGAGDETSDEPTEYSAARGESFRIVDVSYTPDEDLSGDDVPTSDLSLVAGGSQSHLAALEDEQEFRMLISAADDGSTQLVVSSEGHDQFVDVLTGERVDDDVAAAYYLPTTRQEPHHTFPIDEASLPIKSHSSAEEDLVVDYAFQVASASLVAWTADGGWAQSGEAWLVVDWNYEVLAEHPVMPGSIETLSAALSMDVGGEVTKDEVFAEDETGDASGTRTAYVAVPIDTSEVQLSVSGNIEVGMLHGSGLEMAGETTAEFSSEKLTVSFS